MYTIGHCSSETCNKQAGDFPNRGAGEGRGGKEGEREGGREGERGGREVGGRKAVPPFRIFTTPLNTCGLL